MERKRVVIMGAAGRDFHDFNVVFRDDPKVEVVAFTAAQIPGIDRRRYPSELAGPLYPEGIAIVPESNLLDLMGRERVDEVVFAYSDVSHDFVMHQASRVLAAGADFTLLGPDSTMVQSQVPVISICAVRTGAGKSPTSRYIADLLIAEGLRPAMVRHPMPYGNLVEQRVQRFATLEDLNHYQATLEEREEYEPHIRRGLVVWAGVDYKAIVEQAAQESPVIIWDGGNNDFPFVRSDLEIVVADPFRPGHELSYHPGEVNLRRARVVVVYKVNSAPVENVEKVIANVHQVNPEALVVKADSLVTAADGESIAGKKVLVVEDGPTLTHGGMATGAGVAAAQKYGAAEIVDPRPFALGRMAEMYAKYPHLGPVLPAVGYFEDQLRDLEATLAAVPADLIVSATPFALATVIDLTKPLVQVSYDFAETDEPVLADFLHSFLLGRGIIG